MSLQTRDVRTHTGRAPREDRGPGGHVAKPRNAADCQQPPETSQRQEESPLQVSGEGGGSADAWTLDVRPPELRRSAGQAVPSKLANLITAAGANAGTEPLTSRCFQGGSGLARVR